MDLFMNDLPEILEQNLLGKRRFATYEALKGAVHAYSAKMNNRHKGSISNIPIQASPESIRYGHQDIVKALSRSFKATTISP